MDRSDFAQRLNSIVILEGVSEGERFLLRSSSDIPSGMTIELSL